MSRVSDTISTSFGLVGIARKMFAKSIDVPNPELNVGIFCENTGSMPVPKLIRSDVAKSINKSSIAEYTGELPIPVLKGSEK